MDRKTVRKLIASGDLEASRAGNGERSPYRISEAAVEEFLARRKVSPSQAAS